MSLNPNPSKLDQTQIIQRAFDATDDALRTTLASTSFDMTMNSEEGDSIATRGLQVSTKSSISHTNTGVVMPAQSCVGYKTFQLYCHTTSAITGPQACTVEICPSDTDEVWIPIAMTVTPGTSNNAIASAGPTNFVAQRVRISIAAAITTGTFDLYFIQQG